jgi:GGDEF domain-containing protein
VRPVIAAETILAKPFQTTASMDIALCRPGATDGAELLRRADQALYEAKRRGRDGYYFDATDVPASQATPVLTNAAA